MNLALQENNCGIKTIKKRTVKRLPEISTVLFSMNEAIEQLNAILKDSIILRMDFSIEALGSEIEELIDFSTPELSGRPLQSICEGPDLLTEIKERLEGGYFDNVSGNLLSKYGESVGVTISGFYLGLISEINGYVVLKIKVAENVTHLKRELVLKNTELDSFIYRTAHDLRGPLATIKGLVNLIKIRKDNCEVDELTSMIEIHANKLDDRLFKLLYLADVSNKHEVSTESLNFSLLEVTLKKLLADNCHLNNVTFSLNSTVTEVYGVNEYSTRQLVSSLLLYIVSLPVSSVAKENVIEIVMDVKLKGGWLVLSINAHGFKASQNTQSVINNITSLYSDLLINPYLFNYYVAQKRAIELEASMKIDFHDKDTQVVNLHIPIKSCDAALPEAIN